MRTKHRENKLGVLTARRLAWSPKVTKANRLIPFKTRVGRYGTIRVSKAKVAVERIVVEPDALEAALAKALDLATAQGRLDLVERILAHIEKRRGG